MAFDAFALQHAMKPETVETRFLNDDDRKGFPGPRQRLLLQLRKARQQRRNVPGRHRMLRHLLAAARRQRCDQPDRAAQFQRHENCGKIGLDSGRRFGSVSYGWHGRLQSEWFRNLTLPERWSLSTSPWDLESLSQDPHARLGGIWKRRITFGQLKQLVDATDSLGGDNSEFRKMAAKRVDAHRPLLD